jgi:hypothetical protein
MPNGKQGDHAYTDVVIHSMPLYGAEIDQHIRRVAESGGPDEELLSILLEYDPRWGDRGCDYALVESKLRRLLAARPGKK